MRPGGTNGPNGRNLGWSNRVSRFRMRQSTEKIWAMVSHFGMAITGFTAIGALIIFFVFKDKSKFIAHHAYHAMWFFFCVWALAILFSILHLGFLLLPLGIATYVLSAVASFNAMAGNWYEYPITSKFVRRALH